PIQGAAALSLGGQVYVAGGVGTRAVLRFDPATTRVSAAGELPGPAGPARAAGAGGPRPPIRRRGRRRPAPPRAGVRAGAGPSAAGGQASGVAPAPGLAAAAGPGLLSPGSDPSVLPADVLIADHHNNRLLIVDPQGRVRWEFPRPGDLAPGQTFLQPDDAFFSPDGRHIIVTQEDDQVISVISLADRRITYPYTQ